MTARSRAARQPDARADPALDEYRQARARRRTGRTACRAAARRGAERAGAHAHAGQGRTDQPGDRRPVEPARPVALLRALLEPLQEIRGVTRPGRWILRHRVRNQGREGGPLPGQRRWRCAEVAGQHLPHRATGKRRAPGQQEKEERTGGIHVGGSADRPAPGRLRTHERGRAVDLGFIRPAHSPRSRRAWRCRLGQR